MNCVILEEQCGLTLLKAIITKYGRLNIIEFETIPQSNAITRQILAVYPLVARWYSRVRFQIMSGEMLDTIEQHLPVEGTVLDVGCGFGLFTLYLALKRPGCKFIGMELSQRRVDEAKRAAQVLQIKNAEFICADPASSNIPYQPNAAYCMDLLHHMTPQGGDRLLERLFEVLKPGSLMIVKDLTTRPRLKLYYIFLPDLLVNLKDSFYYRSNEAWLARLAQVGFTSMNIYSLKNYLPYPHLLLVRSKPK